MHYYYSLVLLVIVVFSTTKRCNAFATVVVTKNRHQQHQRHLIIQQQSPCSAKMSTEKSNDENPLLLPSILRPEYTIEPIPLRIGHGFDIHRLVPISEAQQPIIIGGVIIDHVDQPWTDTLGTYTTNNGQSTKNSIYTTQLGVLAHSDGDVIYHSLVDAIFGALTLPDIGQVFQDTNEQWKGCDSKTFMHIAYNTLLYYNYTIGNIDITLILERPKVSNYKAGMKANIVKLLHTTESRVNIKARTHEGLDSIGELRAVSCHVVVTLEKKKEKPNLIEGGEGGEKETTTTTTTTTTITNKENFKGF